MKAGIENLLEFLDPEVALLCRRNLGSAGYSVAVGTDGLDVDLHGGADVVAEVTVPVLGVATGGHCESHFQTF